MAHGAGGELQGYSPIADTRYSRRPWPMANARVSTSEINLDTHILDVVNVMKWQELNDVVLVGHSYGGMVISGVAEKRCSKGGCKGATRSISWAH